MRGEEIVAIVPTRRAADGSRVLALPKGHVDPGESADRRPPSARCARRQESSAEPVCELGESRYWYRRGGRTIGKIGHLLPVSLRSGRFADHDDEVEEVRWIPLDRGPEPAQHDAERDIVAQAIDYLDSDRSLRSRAFARQTTSSADTTMQVLNFYSTIFADELTRGRKTATIRLGDKSGKYRKNSWCWSRSATSTRLATGSSKR